jgi:hypothetical protein
MYSELGMTVTPWRCKQMVRFSLRGFGEATNPVQFYSTVVRYNSNGDLDSSFGTDGIVTTNIAGAPQNYTYAMAIQPDVKIVAGGSTQIPRVQPIWKPSRLRDTCRDSSSFS